MTFKNQKEEVLEIELTSYGKHLLSKGKFKPSFYAFFDDDILYDTEYADTQEEQNYAQTRILEETPRTRVQVNYAGVETEVEKQIEAARSGDKELKDAFQNTKERNYSLSAPLGTSSKSSEYAPSWDITLHGGEFSQQKKVKVGDHQTARIPQMEIDDLMYNACIKKVAISNHFEAGLQSYENGYSIEIEPSDFILEIDELHTDSLKENYDMEVFIVEDDEVNGNDVETLIPLSFKKQQSGNVVNGILLDNPEQLPPIQIDETYVEYYLEIDFDGDIRKNRLCELGYSTDFSKRGHIKVNCGTTKRASKMGEIYEEVEQNLPISGDDC